MLNTKQALQWSRSSLAELTQPGLQLLAGLRGEREGGWAGASEKRGRLASYKKTRSPCTRSLPSFLPSPIAPLPPRSPPSHPLPPGQGGISLSSPPPFRTGSTSSPSCSSHPRHAPRRNARRGQRGVRLSRRRRRLSPLSAARHSLHRAAVVAHPRAAQQDGRVHAGLHRQQAQQLLQAGVPVEPGAALRCVHCSLPWLASAAR